MRFRFFHRGERHDPFGHRHARGEFGPRGERHHGERHRHGGRPGRLLEHGDLRMLVLALIAEAPRHGYDIIKAIEERAGGAYSPSPGVVYPTLTMLEELGHIAIGQAEGPRKLYAITSEGEAWLAANQAAASAILARLAELGAEGGPSPQIMRAMHNLKLSLRLRLGRGRLEPAQVAAIAAAIDAAAVAIEQV
ncbi:PadR family transcriptional regulator [Belnapia sp. F-4-1]|uniref:PadR family transcriptional regulator n=1 Tax=Belnapia sp. F-4-1 TaxID=1545443 RepID=UPI0005BBD4F1|nr:PadR family transcriptional regulator [Belnapia sp. F-4-1]